MACQVCISFCLQINVYLLVHSWKNCKTIAFVATTIFVYFSVAVWSEEKIFTEVGPRYLSCFDPSLWRWRIQVVCCRSFGVWWKPNSTSAQMQSKHISYHRVMLIRYLTLPSTWFIYLFTLFIYLFTSSLIRVNSDQCQALLCFFTKIVWVKNINILH